MNFKIFNRSIPANRSDRTDWPALDSYDAATVLAATATGRFDANMMYSRRALLRRVAGVGVAALAVGALGAVAATPAGAATTATTTAALNLRTGPSTSHKVLRVIPKGGLVQLTGDSQNGFRSVIYDGQTGWAHGDYLNTGGGQPPPPGGAPNNARTTAAVNFREGPSLSARVLAVLPAGTPIYVGHVGASGFLSVSYNGMSGWVHQDYIQRTGGAPPPGDPGYDPNTATTTANLNLRAEPSLSARVLLVMPAGAKVALGSGTANGWRQVTYKGTTGWASTAYLN